MRACLRLPKRLIHDDILPPFYCQTPPFLRFDADAATLRMRAVYAAARARKQECGAFFARFIRCARTRYFTVKMTHDAYDTLMLLFLIASLHVITTMPICWPAHADADAYASFALPPMMLARYAPAFRYDDAPAATLFDILLLMPRDARRGERALLMP